MNVPKNLKKIKSLSAIILNLFCIIVITSSCSQNQQPPNIILIMSDDVGYSDIGCYGSEIRTPNLDRLAGNGLRYTQFYNTARCCPTRASLITGLHPHQAGIGHMMGDRGNEHYQGDLNANCLTIAQVLKTAGYKNYMCGKWHMTPLRPSSKDPSKHNWPLQRGFDRFFGTIHGAGSFYDPNSLTSGNSFITPGADFYYTDAISDTAVKYISEHSRDDPFFMYVAYTAAHWPMHALPRDIEKYRGRYDSGWDVIREERYARMIDMGLIRPEWKLSGAYPEGNEWEKQTEEDRRWHAQCMEVYAAMLDNMDQGIGRILAELDKKGLADNTLIVYLQDNGACAEAYGFGRTYTPSEGEVELHPMAPGEFQYNMEPRYTRDGRQVRVGWGVVPGPADTYIGYSQNWANTGNTPFRMFKHWVHEGGISSPLIVHWPEGIDAKNEFREHPSQLVDIMATFVDVSGATYPDTYNGQEIIPLEGVSLAPSFRDRSLNRKALYWEHEGNRAIRMGKWKLVSKASPWHSEHDEHNVLPDHLWELYDLEADRTETVNLASVHPEIVTEMTALWQDWAERSGVVPKPPRVLNRPGWAVGLEE
jgi:arylsulfatase